MCNCNRSNDGSHGSGGVTKLCAGAIVVLIIMIIAVFALVKIVEDGADSSSSSTTSSSSASDSSSSTVPTAAATPFIGLAAGRGTENLPNTQTAITFESVEAYEGKQFENLGSSVSSLTLEAGHNYYISYGVNAFVNNDALGTISTGILVDNVQATPSIATNTSQSLVSTAGGMVVNAKDASKTIALYTIATGDIKLLNAQLTVVQLD